MTAQIINFFDYGPKYKIEPKPDCAEIVVLPVVRVERFTDHFSTDEMPVELPCA